MAGRIETARVDPAPRFLHQHGNKLHLLYKPGEEVGVGLTSLKQGAAGAVSL